MTCVRLANKRRKVSPGDLNKRVELFVRNMRSPGAGSVDFGYDSPSLGQRWAGVETLSGKTFFDEVNQRDLQLTHVWYIRFDSTVTSETWLQYNGRRFDILSVEDLEEEHEFMALYCIDKGKSQT